MIDLLEKIVTIEVEHPEEKSRRISIKLADEEIGHMLSLGDSGDCYFIMGFLIKDEKLRGKGYGSQALQQVIEFCRTERRFSAVHLSCSEIRRPFYERNGFVYISPGYMCYQL